MRVIGYYSGLFRGRVEIYIDGLLRNIDRSVRLPFSRRRNIWKKERGEKWYFQEELTRRLSEYCKVNFNIPRHQLRISLDQFVSLMTW